VIVIGAGPYGLSLAAFLRSVGVEFKVFGKPMSFWRDSCPPGMELKSEGASSDMFEPGRQFTIKEYYKEISRPFVGRVLIPAEIFVKYGLEFQKRFVPNVDPRLVVSVSRSENDFSVRLEDGTVLNTEHVVLALGVRDFAYIPEVLRTLPSQFVSHSVEYGRVDRFVDQKVYVVGAGASAVNLAWALHERGFETAILCREPEIGFHQEPPPRTWRSAIRAPDSPIGGGWKPWFYANAPHLFRLLPEKTRHRIVANALGPSPGWVMTARVPGKVQILGGMRLISAEVVNDRVNLTTKASDGAIGNFTVDHIVAATGYRVDVNQMSILDEAIKKNLRTSQGSPILSENFESTVPGLYFVGLASAVTFGPVMRFVAGSGFTSRKLSRRLAAVPRITPGRSIPSEALAAK